MSVCPLLPLQEVDASVVRKVCSKYFYDQCPAVAGLGEWPRVPVLCPSSQASSWPPLLPVLPPTPTPPTLAAANRGP